MMNLGDVSEKVVPKMSLVAPPVNGGNICTRTFIPHTCHTAIGVLGAVSVATACTITGSVTEGIAVVPPSRFKTMSIEHPAGELTVELHLDQQGNVVKSGLLRTARLLSRGELYL
jgi:4-oxalomesaconate tautomerase